MSGAVRLIVGFEETIGAEEEAENQRTLGAMHLMAAAGRPPNIVASSDLSLGVDHASLDDKTLFELNMLVERKTGAGLETEQGGEQAGVRIFHKDLHVDPGKPGRDPRQVTYFDVAGS